MKQSRAPIFIGLAVVAIIVGLLLGRTCGKSNDVVDAGAPRVIDAGVVAVADAGEPIVDAGVLAAADAGATDAGSDALAVVAPVDKHGGGGGGGGRGGGGGHHRTERVEKPPVEKPAPKPKEEPKPAAVVDAGVVAVADAGVAAAAVAHKDLEPEKMPSAPIAVTYTDGVSTWLKLTQVRVFIDGKRVTDEHDDKGIDAVKARTFHSGVLFPGTHQVRVETLYIGKANGLFSYMEGIKLHVRGMTVVQMAENKRIRVDAVAYDKGALEEFENRAGLKITAVDQ